MERSGLYFITGGVRSGKSSFAEKTAVDLAIRVGGNLHYLACGRRVDDEMEDRIERHQRDRESGPLVWRTAELPTDITRIVKDLDTKSIVLLDCLTTLLDNELFQPGVPLEEEFLRKTFRKIIDGIDEIRNKAFCLIVVSNEVVQEPLFQDEFLHMYGRMLGLLHQAIVEQSDCAYLVESGIQVTKKEGFLV